MPTDLPPDYKPKPMPPEGPGTSDPAAPPHPPGIDSPGAPGEEAPVGPDVGVPIPGTVPSPAGLPSF